MPIDESKLKNQAKSKDREIQELKELLAEAESEIKELNDFHGFQKPKSSILESAFLNKVIKYSFFAVLCVFIILVALYPWLNKDKFAGDQPDEEITQEEDLTIDSETKGVEEEQEEIRNAVYGFTSELEYRTAVRRTIIFYCAVLVGIIAFVIWIL